MKVIYKYLKPYLPFLLLAIMLTHKNYRGILELINLFRSHSGEAPKEPEIVDYQLVRRYVSQVIAEKNQMTQQITQYSDSRKYEVLDKLVRNTYNSREEAAHALEESALTIREGRNIVLCIRCPEVSYETVLSDGVTVRETVRQIFGELLEQPYVLFDTATYPADMDSYIFPAMEELGIPSLTLEIGCRAGLHPGDLERVHK